MNNSLGVPWAPSQSPKEEHFMKKAYRKPTLRRLGLLRQVTRFSF
ncbi:MAG TPA: hypothetical protein VEL74_22425 [Thermoanaerobaculia bacterium]|nr:hypothetical protein [Thermoanaerobaculia bacterium]